MGIELKNEFAVAASPDETYKALVDILRVTPCIPGARIIGPHKDGGYEAEMSLKLGPMNMVFAGPIKILEQSEKARRAVYWGSATERKGRGTASAKVVLAVGPGSLSPEGSAITVNTDLGIGGRVAQMGRGVMEGVAGELIRTMADNLEKMLAQDAATGSQSPVGTAPLEQQTGSSLKVGSLMAGALASKLRHRDE